MDNKMNIGEVIRVFRKAKGLTMKELGEQIDLSEQAISQYELGKRSPDVGVTIKISNALGVTYRELLKGTNLEGESNYKLIENVLLQKQITAVDAFSELIKSCGFDYEEYREPSEGYDNVMISKGSGKHKKKLDLTRAEYEYIFNESMNAIKEIITKFNGIPDNPLNNK